MEEAVGITENDFTVGRAQSYLIISQMYFLHEELRRARLYRLDSIKCIYINTAVQ